MPRTSLPEHTVRVSGRARRIRLTVTPRDGLVVVLPREADRRQVPGILRAHGLWIERAMERTAERRARMAAAAAEPLPTRVSLPAIGLELDVAYHSAPGLSRAVERGGALAVHAPEGDHDAAIKALRRWLTRAARRHLPAMLEEISLRECLPFAKVTVRAQRSRWGSCSRHGAISLNRALLFLTRDQAEYVLVHELLHTVRLDHSPVFWRLLEERVPDARGKRRALRDAWRHVPGWASVEADG